MPQKSALEAVLQRLYSLKDARKNLGLTHLFGYAVQRARAKLLPITSYTVRSRYAEHALYVRNGTSDVEVFGQIFVHREYRCLDPLRDVRRILDLGANVGYASAYFLSRFPDALVTSVEPDARNYAALVRNVAPYGSRCTTVNAAVWSESVPLAFAEHYGDGREWAVAVRETRHREHGTVRGVDMRTLVDSQTIDLLKIDIEGAELEVFSGDCSWLQNVKNIVIELHGPSCRTAFDTAVSPHSFLRSRCDELDVLLSPAQ